jgi:hypothetical protein
VDARLDTIVQRALAHDPQRRYADATAMLVELEAWSPPPKSRAPESSQSSSETSKTAMGDNSPLDEAAARRAILQAIELSRQPGKLMEAADALEEALLKAPLLRKQYEYQLSLWRKGVVM